MECFIVKVKEVVERTLAVKLAEAALGKYEAPQLAVEAKLQDEAYEPFPGNGIYALEENSYTRVAMISRNDGEYNGKIKDAIGKSEERAQESATLIAEYAQIVAAKERVSALLARSEELKTLGLEKSYNLKIELFDALLPDLLAIL